MFATVKIDIPLSGWSDDRLTISRKEEFWSKFDEIERRSKGSGDRPERSSRTFDDLEEKFRSKFPRELHARLSELINSRRNERPERRGWFGLRQETVRPEFEIKLVRLEYGSLMALLEFLGLTSEDVRNLLVAALQICIAPAFCAALQTDVPIDAVVYVDTGGSGVEAPQQTNGPAMTILKYVSVIVGNLFLIVPVVLALAVCYYDYNGLRDRHSDLTKENGDFRSERTKIVDALIDQNKKISTAMVDNAKSALASARSSQQLLVTLVMKKELDRNGRKGDSEKPKTVVDSRAEQSPESNINYNICVGANEDSYRTHSNPRFTSSGRLKRAIAGGLFGLCPAAAK